jgi:hypothetical protein
MFTKTPLVFIPFLFCTLTSFTPGKEKNVVSFKGNKIELGSVKVVPNEYRKALQQRNDMLLFTTVPDSVLIKEWPTGKMVMQEVLKDIIPVSINGEPITGNEQQYCMRTDPSYIAPFLPRYYGGIETYLFVHLESELNKLDDGEYLLNVNKLVVDNAGNIAYYEANGISGFMSRQGVSLVKEDLKQNIDQKMLEALNGPIKFEPALINDKPVNARISADTYSIVVKNHKASLVARGGC